MNDAPLSRRSPCPIAAGLDLFGDKWTLLILRDLFVGPRRFSDFTKSPEGIATNILSARLESLKAAGIVELRPVEGRKRPVYALTEKGRRMRPILEAVRDWALAELPGAQALLDLPSEA